MPALVVVFDTNAYVQLNVSRLKAIQAREKAQGVIAMAAHHTLFELIAGTLDADMKKAAWRRGALKRLYYHCTGYNGSQRDFRHLAYSDAQAAFDLFGVYSQRYEELAQPLLALAHYQATREDASWGPLLAVAEKVRDVRDEMEKSFTASLFESVVKRLAPNAATWADIVTGAPLRREVLTKAATGEGKQLLAGSIAKRAARHIDRELTEFEYEAAAERARRQYPVPVALLDQIITAIVRDGKDMSLPENANSLWDYEICFSVGHGTHIYGAPIHLVSTDNGILRAAASVAAPNVRSLLQYEALLGLPYSEFRNVVDLPRAAR